MKARSKRGSLKPFVTKIDADENAHLGIPKLGHVPGGRVVKTG
jgi:hypothetical protein